MENISVLLIPHPLHSDVVEVRLRGVLHPGSLASLEKDLRELFSGGSQYKVIFDLSDTLFISSGGWSLFLDCHQRLKNSGGEMLLAGMQSDVLEAFDLLGFNNTFRSFRSADQALTLGLGKLPIPSISLDPQP